MAVLMLTVLIISSHKHHHTIIINYDKLMVIIEMNNVGLISNNVYFLFLYCIDKAQIDLKPCKKN